MKRKHPEHDPVAALRMHIRSTAPVSHTTVTEGRWKDYRSRTRVHAEE